MTRTLIPLTPQLIWSKFKFPTSEKITGQLARKFLQNDEITIYFSLPPQLTVPHDILRDRFGENFKYPLFTNVKSGIRKMSEAPNLGSMDKIEPEDIAIILIERVVDYCSKQRDALACLKEYGPNKINILINIFLTLDERKIFSNMILNSNMPKHEILSDMIDEYEVRWKFKILKKISEFISNKLNLFLNSIISSKHDNSNQIETTKSL
jgi:hypothetical protein